MPTVTRDLRLVGIIALALLAVGSTGRAEQSAAATDAPPEGAALAETNTDTPRRAHVLGLALDVGFPDLGAVTVQVRPWTFLRFGATLLYNTAGFGLRGSVSVQPNWVVAPSLNFELGHYFEAPAYDRIAGLVPELPSALRQPLDQLSWTFVNAQLGLEIGHPNWFVFFVRVGVSRMWVPIHGVEAVMDSLVTLPGGAGTSSATEALLTLQVPSAKAGFLFYFY